MLTPHQQSNGPMTPRSTSLGVVRLGAAGVNATGALRFPARLPGLVSGAGVEPA